MRNAERKASLSLDQTTSSVDNTSKVKSDKKVKSSAEEVKPIEMKDNKEQLVKEVKEVGSGDEVDVERDLLCREMPDELSETSPSDDTQEVDGEGFKAVEVLLNKISLASLKAL